jgi:Fe-S oxidoreductase
VIGLMPWWGPLAARAPRVANALSHSRWLAPPAKRLIGVAPERQLPAFATETFRTWFKQRAAHTPPAWSSRRRVVLWPDTFTDLFEPHVGRAAVEVLEAAGFAVELPERRVCCGRPLYDFGMLGLAKRALRDVLDALSEPIQSGVPVLVLEPSCASVFRDELRKLMPHDEHARRLVAQTVVLDELLDRHAPEWEPPSLRRHGARALIHGHCHQHAVIGVSGERNLLGRAGLEATLLNAGCCGMAGSFGYGAGEQYEISMRVGERVLLPAIRGAGEDTLLVADGFSCRTQIVAGTGRRALHTAEVLAQALQPIA